MSKKIINDCILPMLECCNCSWWTRFYKVESIVLGTCDNQKSDHYGHIIVETHQQCDQK